MRRMVAYEVSSPSACVFLTVFILGVDTKCWDSDFVAPQPPVAATPAAPQLPVATQPAAPQLPVATKPSIPQCGGSYTGSGGIQSPNYPGFYPNQLICTWTIQASPIEGRIYLQFEAFATESCCDFLRINNGSTQVSWYSGSLGSFGILLGSQATLQFTTNSITGDSGFSISFTTFVGVCGLNFNNNGLIQSPSYLPTYMTQCSWSLTALPLQNIRLLFLEFNLRICCDALWIYSTSNGARTVSRLSGSVLPTSIIIGNSAEMRFSSYAGYKQNVFRICFYSTTSLTSSASALQIGRCVKFLSDPWPELCSQPAEFNLTCTCAGCIYASGALAISRLRVLNGESELVCGLLVNVQYSCVISARVSGSLVDAQNVSVLLIPEKLPTEAPPTQPTTYKTGAVIAEQLRSNKPEILVGTSEEQSMNILPSTLAGVLVGVLLAPLLVGLSVAAWRRRWYVHVFGLLTSKIRSLRKANIEENIYENSLPVALASSGLNHGDIAVAHVDGLSNLAYNIDVDELQTNDLYIGGEVGDSEEEYDGAVQGDGVHSVAATRNNVPKADGDEKKKKLEKFQKGTKHVAFTTVVSGLQKNNLDLEGAASHADTAVKWDGEAQVNLDGSSRTEKPQQIGLHDGEGNEKLHDVTPQKIVKKALIPPRTRLKKPAGTYGEVGGQLYETLKIPNLNDGEPTYARLDL